MHLEWQDLTLGEPGLMNDTLWKMFQHLRSTERDLQKCLGNEVLKSQ